MTQKLIRDDLIADVPPHQIRQVADVGEHLALLLSKHFEAGLGILSTGFTNPAHYAEALDVIINMSKVAGIEWPEIVKARRDNISAGKLYAGGYVHCPDSKAKFSTP